MKLTKSILLFLSLIFSAASALAESVIETKIVGGTQASVGEYPWAVLLSGTSSPSGFFCGGSLIAEKWVLTAAHCVVDESAGNLYAFAGEYNKLTYDITANPIDKIIVHPNYDAVSSDNDLALLRLTYPETSIIPLNIITPAVASSLEAGVDDSLADVTVIGWGDTEDPVSPTYPSILREVNLPYVSNTVCNSSVALNGQVNANMMCAGAAAGGIDSCQGDSGGPLVFQDAGIWYQAGIVSWGYGCAEPNKYGVYTRVENYIDWIEQTQTVTPYITFGTWVNGYSVSAQIEVDNSTGTSFNINSIVSSNDTVFQVGTDTCNTPVADGETCVININFIASVTGNYSGNIAINTDAGNYTTQVSGTIATPAVFNFVELDSSLEWALGGDSNWYERNITTSGYALQSGDISDSQSSSVFTYVTVSASGTRNLYFDWKSCSEPNYDYLQLWVDGEKKDALSGDVDWSSKTLVINGEGDHIVEWRYNKDYTVTRGDDAGWIDNVSLDVPSGNSLPVHNTTCDIAPPPPPPPSGGGGALSGWFYLGMVMPLLFRLRRKN